MNSETKYIKVVRTSNWTKGGHGDLPTRVVMWQPDDFKAKDGIARENQYSTHYEVKNEQGCLHFTSGHYDMSRSGAEADFARRCALIEVGEATLGNLVR